MSARLTVAADLNWSLLRHLHATRGLSVLGGLSVVGDFRSLCVLQTAVLPGRLALLNPSAHQAAKSLRGGGGS